MKQRVEQYLPNAIRVVTSEQIADIDRNVPSQYNGYISSLGASIIQSGLLPTIAFFSSTESRSEEDRNKIIKAVFKIIIQSGNANAIIPSDFLDYTNNHENKKLLLEQILDAATALKLAIRTFNIIRQNGRTNDE